jgi:hypothetical protein
MTGYRFLGAVYDSPSKRAQLMFGGMARAGPHLVRGISNIKSVTTLSDERDDSDTALSIVSDGVQTLLVLEHQKEGL